MTTQKECNTIWKANQLKALASIGFVGSFRTLRALENWAHWYAEQYCNDEKYGNDPDRFETDKAEIARKVSKLFGGTLPNGFFINSDPRGYALKLDNESVSIPEGMTKDWGGYGILAPDFN